MMPDDVNQNDQESDFAPLKSGPFIALWNLAPNNAQAWHQWAHEHNIADAMQPNDMHCTMLYCPTNPIDKEWPDALQAAWDGKPKGVGILGKALVIFFDAPQFIQARFDQLNREWPHSFPTFIPHVSLTYDAEQYKNQLPYMNANLPDQPLRFNNETIDIIRDPTKSDSSSDLGANLQFLTAFQEAFKVNKDIARAFVEKDMRTYRLRWVKILESMTIGE
jgi:hypothetical protein